MFMSQGKGRAIAMLQQLLKDGGSGSPILKTELLPGQSGPNQCKKRAVCIAGISWIFKDKLKSLGT